MVALALDRVAMGESTAVPAAPATPVGEIAAAVRRLAGERGQRVTLDITDVGVLITPR
jgi:hypothetical protein